ncbi:CRISPR-associated endonuclease Cas1 [Aminithiophilus ramosus]|uniref:CRISPR-associated endonuclease Cas1 n=2 Tax=Synergistales TaxID=649776 RepID=A0A9Q7ABV5_9BACT|nr:CRISPR-associated endonuclease Cas1 [Aminithiophilus ramosus]QTX32148.1 CRISPR-associated endonuclease Cas1 [Aminithiophilus ramosus]QVL36016.1 CRISPR-associated endonuclease Cas1 [Synergistota bacterium]
MDKKGLEVLHGYRGPHLSLFCGADEDQNPFFLLRSAQMRVLNDAGQRLAAARWLLRGVLAVYRIWQCWTKAPVEAILKRTAPAIEEAPDIESLRGVEGAFHRDLFDLWQEAFGAPWHFEERNRRPPRDPINAFLSYGNSIVYSLCVPPIQRKYLHSALSILHEPGARRHSLALDMAELYKPLLVEAPLWTLLKRKGLLPDMTVTDIDGCRLSAESRQIFRRAMRDVLFPLYVEESRDRWGWPLFFWENLETTAAELGRRCLRGDFSGHWFPSGLVWPRSKLLEDCMPYLCRTL